MLETCSISSYGAPKLSRGPQGERPESPAGISSSFKLTVGVSTPQSNCPEFSNEKIISKTSHGK